MILQRRWRRYYRAGWLAGMLLCAANFSSAVCAATTRIAVTDDSGKPVQLPAQASRIISLAPHITELLFAAGAGKSIIGVTSYSDYPREATQIASVGNSTQIDIERIVSLKPDLVVAWKSGNSARQIAQLRKLGIAVFESEPHSLDQIASSIERLAILTGKEETGYKAAAEFRMQLTELKKKYQQRAAVTVFYQIWSQPLMTLNGSHLVSEAIALCGGKNLFGTLPQIAPVVSIEAVVRADPEVIFISDEQAEARKRWQPLSGMTAVKRHHIFTLDSTLMNRAGPRMLTGVKQLCENLEIVRSHRSNQAAPYK